MGGSWPCAPSVCGALFFWKVERLFELLLAFHGPGVFNPYRDWDAALDRPGAPSLRRANLRCYLELFAGADYVLVGEAAGYAGCRFSGIPFTTEAQLLGPQPLPWAAGGEWAQSSLNGPWQERSAHIVWSALNVRRDCVLWNAFPWHPFRDKPLSNRRPRTNELQQAADVLLYFLSLFPQAKVFAIGRVSQNTLAGLGIRAAYIRHPSHGGQRDFVAGVQALPHRGP